MPYTTQSEEIAFFNGDAPVTRYLPVDGHPLRETLGNTTEIYEAKQLKREELLLSMKQWVEKLSNQPKCVWEANKQAEVNKELKRIRRNPEVAVPELKKSFHGCDYLLKQWEYLKRVVNADAFSGKFTVADETLILGLCAVPFWNRDGRFEFLPCFGMKTEEARAHIGSFIQEKIDALRELSMAHKAEEERERELTIAAPEFFPDKKLRGWTKDLHKLERELTAIYSYVQSLLKPEAKPDEASVTVTTQQARLAPKCVEPAAEQTRVEALQKPLETTQTPEISVHAPKPEISKPILAPRPTPPIPSKPPESLTRSQARKLRFREAEKRKSQKLVADLLERSLGQPNILDITIGKSWF